MFDDDVRREIERAAKSAGWDAAALLAVVEVESGGKAFAVIDGRREPLIRFEGHYFDRRLSGKKRAQARAAGLANPNAGTVKNPRTQASRWALLRKAAEIDIKAAYESVSWGVGQVMGAHWKTLGYSSVDEMVSLARSGVYGQVQIMCRFIKVNGLSFALIRGNWAKFAHGYNGPAYAKYGYDKKLAAAYGRYAKLPALPPEPPKPTEKPTSAQKPAPTTSDASIPSKSLPAPAQESKTGLWAKLLTLLGLGGVGTGAATVTPTDPNQLAAFVIFGGLVLCVIIAFIVWRKGRK